MAKISYDQRKKIKNISLKVIIYALLTIFGFIFITPIFQALTKSFMSLTDMTNPSVNYIANDPTLVNYTDIINSFNVPKSILYSIVYAGGSALLQTISCALIGYGLSRYDFKFKKVILFLILLVFLIPPQTLMTPSFVLMGKLHINNSLLAFFVPALLGQGIKSSIFILIFYTFFNAIPLEIYEAASLEGAKPLHIFRKITLPLVKGAIAITFLLSFVWYWNETYMADLYYRGIETFPMQVSKSIAAILAKDPNKLPNVPIYDGLQSAAIILLIIPLILFYFILQRQFKQGIENTGITGK